MIQVTETKRYHVNARKLVQDAFESAYTKSIEENLPKEPPDMLTTVTACISMLLLSGMFFVTASVHSSQKTVWWAFAFFCLLCIVWFVRKYLKGLKEYQKTAGKPSTKDAKKNAFIQLFGQEELSEEMQAADLLRKTAALIGKQNNPLYETALRILSDALTARNNPGDLMCKLVTPFGEIFTQSKRRFYLCTEDNQLIFYDAEFMKPKGEIICNQDDVVSFGTFSKYPLRINSYGGGKIRPEAVILEIQDESQHIYFEFQSQEYDKIKKLLSGRKELK